jgi:hypothetical protein
MQAERTRAKELKVTKALKVRAPDSHAIPVSPSRGVTGQSFNNAGHIEEL